MLNQRKRIFRNLIRNYLYIFSVTFGFENILRSNYLEKTIKILYCT